MFITIKKSLQLYYKKNLLIKELNDTKNELESKKQEIEQMETDHILITKQMVS